MLASFLKRYSSLRGLFVDMMCLEFFKSIPLPLLTLLCFRADSPLFDANYSAYNRGVYFGMIMGFGKLAGMVGHIVLGYLSDYYSRVLLLLVAAVGLFAAGLFGCIGIYYGSPIIFTLSFIVVELLYSAKPAALVIAQERVDNNFRVQSLSYVQFFIAIGATFGPIVGGFCILNVASYWHYLLPWVLIFVGSLILMWRRYHQLDLYVHSSSSALQDKDKASVQSMFQGRSPYGCCRDMLVQLKNNKFLCLSWLLLLLPQFSWGSFYELLAPVMQTRFNYSGSSIGLVLGGMAASVVFASMIIVPKMRAIYSEVTMALLGSIILTAGLLVCSMAVACSAYRFAGVFVICSVLPVAVGDVLLFCLFFSWVGSSVSASRRGFVSGVAYASILAVWSIDGFIGGHLIVNHLSWFLLYLPLGALSLLVFLAVYAKSLHYRTKLVLYAN